MAGRDFDEFFAANYDAVARTLTIATGARDVADDATQEAFTRALRHWRSVCTMERPVGWVYVVAMNHVRDRHRRAQRAQSLAPEPESDPIGGVATRLSVREAIATLPPRQREAVVLRFLADLPVAEVANAMGCAVGTAKATLHHAMATLRVELTEDDDEN